jgi:hypothetical protein
MARRGGRAGCGAIAACGVRICYAWYLPRSEAKNRTSRDSRSPAVLFLALMETRRAWSIWEVGNGERLSRISLHVDCQQLGQDCALKGQMGLERKTPVKAQ